MKKENPATEIALLSQDVRYIRNELDGLTLKISNQYVTREEFTPVKNIAFGLIGLISVTVVGALLALVINR